MSSPWGWDNGVRFDNRVGGDPFRKICQPRTSDCNIEIKVFKMLLTQVLKNHPPDLGWTLKPMTGVLILQGRHRVAVKCVSSMLQALLIPPPNHAPNLGRQYVLGPFMFDFESQLHLYE